MLMEYVNVKFDNDCRDKLIEGVNLCVKAIETTYGPDGRNSLIRTMEGIKITKDGFHTAMAVNDPDPYITMGIKLIQDTCKKVAKDVGDGTSTVSILTREIINHFKDVDDPIITSRMLQEAVTKIEDFLKNKAKPVSSKEDLIKVATISANNDPIIGNLVAEAFDKVGKDGIVSFEESEEVKDRIEYSDGFRIDRGYSSPYFINTSRNTCELENVRVAIFDTKVEEVKHIISLADQAVKDKKSLLLIAPEFDSEILVFLSSNLELLKSCTVISPSARNFRDIMLKDMRDLLGESSECKKVIITKDHTTFLGCNSNTQNIEKKIKDIRELIKEGNLPEFDMDFHKKRLANFTSGIATIYVGGFSKVEMKERYDRIEDAVYATQAALNGGILAGGGKVLMTTGVLFGNNSKLFNILSTPSRLLKTIDKTEEDMINSGVIEPFLVTKTVLENAVSTASLILSANVAILDMENFYND